MVDEPGTGWPVWAPASWGRPDHARRLAEVLGRYSITEFDLAQARGRENQALRVTDLATRQSYLLRLHEPVSAGLLGVQHAFEGLRGL